jgi:hypothetical protein
MQSGDALGILGIGSGMGAVASDPGFGMGAVAAPSPSPGFPVTGDPRQKSINGPTQIRVDAANLRILGYAAPDTGNAYDPKFMAAVRDFQTASGSALVGAADGLIGPSTREVLAEAARIANRGATVTPATLPSSPGGGGLSTVLAGGDGSISPVVIAAGAIGVGVVAWLLLK